MDEKKIKNFSKKSNVTSFESIDVAEDVKFEELPEVKNELEDVIPMKEENIFEEKVAVAEVVEPKKNTIKGKVRCVHDNGDIAVNLDGGRFVMKRGYFNVKVGDILDFEI